MAAVRALITVWVSARDIRVLTTDTAIILIATMDSAPTLTNIGDPMATTTGTFIASIGIVALTPGTDGRIASINRSATVKRRLIASTIVFVIGKGGLTVPVYPFVILGRDFVTGANRKLLSLPNFPGNALYRRAVFP